MTPDEISLHRSDVRRLRSHAKSLEPSEACAMLLGVNDGNSCTVQEIFLTGNADESPTSFAIPNEDLFEGYATAHRKGIDVVGIFHSHPHSEARPSEKDAEFMRISPVAWIIYSGLSGRMRAFAMHETPREIRISEIL